METTRAKWTRVRNTLTVTLKFLTADDKETLRSFLKDTVNYGALPFLLTDPRNAENPVTRTVRMAGLPKYSDAGWVAADALGNAAQYRWNCSFQVREV